LIMFFTWSGTTFVQTFYFVSALLPVIIGTSFYFNQKLVPDYLMQQKYGQFTLYLVYTIIISLYLQMLVIFLSLLIFNFYQRQGINFLTINLLSLSLIMYLIVLVNAFVHIVQAFNQKKEQVLDLENNIVKNKAESILIKANRKQHQIFFENLLFIESLGDYIKINTEDGNLTTKEKISAIQQRLPDDFVRIHRSYIINLKKVDSFNKELVTIKEQELPISRTYKKQALAYLDA